MTPRPRRTTEKDSKPGPSTAAAADQMLRMKRVAERLDVGLMTAYRLVYAGELPWVNVARPGTSRASVRVSKSALAEYIRRRERDGIPRWRMG